MVGLWHSLSRVGSFSFLGVLVVCRDGDCDVVSGHVQLMTVVVCLRHEPLVCFAEVAVAEFSASATYWLACEISLVSFTAEIQKG